MQFHLKTLLIVVTGAALAAAAMAPWFRSLEEVTQTRLVLIFGTLGVVNLASLAILAVFERLERRRAGECWKVIRTRARWPWGMMLVWAFIAITHTALLVREIVYESGKGSSLDKILYDGFPGILMWTYWLPMVAVYFRMSQVRFHEHGLIYGRFISRQSIRSWRWSRDALTIILQKWSRQDIPIREADQAEIEGILKRWSAANAESDAPNTSANRIMLFSLPLVFLVPMLFMAWRFFGPAPAPVPAPTLPTPAVVAPVTVPASSQ